jgi:hypothetical protein
MMLPGAARKSSRPVANPPPKNHTTDPPRGADGFREHRVLERSGLRRVETFARGLDESLSDASGEADISGATLGADLVITVLVEFPDEEDTESFG